MMLDSNYAVQELDVKTPTLAISVRPALTRSDLGYVLAGFTGEFTTDTERGSENVQVEYQTIEGFVLPHTVRARINYPQFSVDISLTFSNYELQTHGSQKNLDSNQP